MTRVAIFGASGYGGQELLRLLANHPDFMVVAATSDRLAGAPIEAMQPQLEGFYPGLEYTSPADDLPEGCEACFLAVPHGSAAPLVARLGDSMRIVDLSMDFRLDAERFVYGLTETNRIGIAKSHRVANPGCFATAALLALAPLAERGLLTGDVTLAQTTGSSGSGATVKAGTHHPERAQDMRAYKVLVHQHEPEIVCELRRLGADGFDVAMVPQSGPFSRGIFSVAHVRVPAGTDAAAIYAERYGDEFFVRVRELTPTLRHVARTNFCDIAVHQRGERVAILTAIDNLGKGMAGQAIQNMNLLFGLDETTGLKVPGGNA